MIEDTFEKIKLLKQILYHTKNIDKEVYSKDKIKENIDSILKLIKDYKGNCDDVECLSYITECIEQISTYLSKDCHFDGERAEFITGLTFNMIDNIEYEDITFWFKDLKDILLIKTNKIRKI